MPWVRLHGIKDYIGMALLLEDFPRIHQTFNYVPCLLDQLEDYAHGRASDRFWKLTKMSVEDLTVEDKLYILDNFFSANQQTMIDIYPRYKELLGKRSYRKKLARDVLKNFSLEDFQDLQVWSNLTWYSPLVIQRDHVLSELIRKGRGFTREDKEIVLSKQIDVIRQIIPLHKRLQDLGRIEITTSPYYHPILPLLCNQESAKVVLPKLSLPEKRLFAQEDAKIQVERAVHTYSRHFGQNPSGMWPSEGAVSDDVVPIVVQAGFRWLASDEGVLACSLKNQILRDEYGVVVAPDLLYKPYQINIKGNNITMVFRDHTLSDLVGFQYSKYTADAAVSDFIDRIKHLKDRNKSGRPLLVAIILDGENAWEYYQNNGIDFLRKLYEAISNDSDLECVRICDYLAKYPPEQTLQHICPGSWIGHNLATWIGHEEKNAAWSLLEDTRSFILNRSGEANLLPADNIKKAWEEIYIAEGSDWFWWYGDDHATQYKNEFDSLFRLHLKNVYKFFNADTPWLLEVPIAGTGMKKLYTYPKRFLDVKLDGMVSNYFEWLDAGRYLANKDMGTMQRTSGQPVQGVSFGFDIDNLFVRVDFNKDFSAQDRGKGKLVITFILPNELQIHTSALMDKPSRFTIKKKDLRFVSKNYYSIALDKILELACPFADLGFFPGLNIEFFIEFVKEDEIIQRMPMMTVFCFTAPSKDFERMMWQV